MSKEKQFVHADMDAFFACVEERDNPSLRGKPIVVGSDPKGGKGRGVVSTCSYQARKFGIHSAMPISIAFRLCPEAVFLPVNMEKYEKASWQIYSIFEKFTPDIEPIGLDEAFLDITGSFHLFGTPEETCMKIKKAVKDETGLPVSIGLAPIKMAAKIASDLSKPDGFIRVTSEGLLDFLWPLDIRKLWGIGPKTEIILRRHGINKIGDIAGRDFESMSHILGKSGRHLWELANGIDERDVSSGQDAKSLSNERTFDKDTRNKELIKKTLMDLSEEVSDRLSEGQTRGRTITLKVRNSGFVTYTRARTLPEPTNYSDVIFSVVYGLFEELTAGNSSTVRLLGVKVSNFDPGEEKQLNFGETRQTRNEHTHKAITDIKNKFGRGAIRRATGIIDADDGGE